MEAVTVDDILAYIRDNYADASEGDPGATVEELRVAWGIDERTVRKRIKPLLAAGKMVVGMAPRRKMDGRVQKVPVYRVA